MTYTQHITETTALIEAKSGTWDGISAEAVANRIGTRRPLLREGGVEAWEKLVEARREIYERLATRSWDTSSRPIDDIASEVAEWIRPETEQAQL